MENRIYISVLSISNSGSIDVTFATYGTATDTTFVAQVTGLNSAISEKANAANMLTQLSTIIAQHGATYNGYVNGVPYGPAPTFRVTRTDHCLCIFSEAQFSIDIADHTGQETAGIYLVREIPIPITLCEAKVKGPVMGQAWVDPDTGDGLSDSLIAEYLAAAAADVLSECRNNFVASTYIFEMDCNGTDGVQLPHYPLISVDAPYIRRPDIFSFITAAISSDPLTLYFPHAQKGYLNYRFVQDMLMAYEPFDEHNILRLSYVAGEQQIPEVLKAAVLRLTSLTEADSEIGELQGGTFRIKQNAQSSARKDYISPLRRYFR